MVDNLQGQAATGFVVKRVGVVGPGHMGQPALGAAKGLVAMAARGWNELDWRSLKRRGGPPAHRGKWK
jgi:hypothetical protein